MKCVSQNVPICYVCLCSNFQTKLLALCPVSMFQQQGASTAMVVLKCRIQKQLEVTSMGSLKKKKVVALNFCDLLWFVSLDSLQIFHGADRGCLFPPPLPAALPGPTSSCSCSGGRNAKLRWHCHELCCVTVFKKTLKVYGQGQQPLWSLCETRRPSKPRKGSQQWVPGNVASPRAPSSEVLLSQQTDTDLWCHATQLLQSDDLPVRFPQLC